MKLVDILEGLTLETWLTNGTLCPFELIVLVESDCSYFWYMNSHISLLEDLSEVMSSCCSNMF